MLKGTTLSESIIIIIIVNRHNGPLPSVWYKRYTISFNRISHLVCYVFKSTLPVSFLEMEKTEALRLVQIHNSTDKVDHEVNTKEKVCNQPS